MKAFKVEIRCWSDNPRKHIADDISDAGDKVRNHAEHVAQMIGDGYTSGQITDDNFSGWWEIVEEEKPKRTRRR